MFLFESAFKYIVFSGNKQANKFKASEQLLNHDLSGRELKSLLKADNTEDETDDESMIREI